MVRLPLLGGTLPALSPPADGEGEDSHAQEDEGGSFRNCQDDRRIVPNAELNVDRITVLERPCQCSSGVGDWTVREAKVGAIDGGSIRAPHVYPLIRH